MHHFSTQEAFSRHELFTELQTNIQLTSPCKGFGKGRHKAASNLPCGALSNANIQSADRRFHNKETALLRVTNDLLRAVDQHHEAVLVLLHLSVAFDMINHVILLQRLTTKYGITSALAWFTSYLKGRVQTVNIYGTLSKERALRFGVKQGSVIGPISFTM